MFTYESNSNHWVLTVYKAIDEQQQEIKNSQNQ